MAVRLFKTMILTIGLMLACFDFVFLIEPIGFSDGIKGLVCGIMACVLALAAIFLENRWIKKDRPWI